MKNTSKLIAPNESVIDKIKKAKVAKAKEEEQKKSNS